MITLNITLPETVAAEFFQAADALNRRFGETKPGIEAKTLMAFALARFDSRDVCAQFDLALRMIQGPVDRPFNPVLK